MLKLSEARTLQEFLRKNFQRVGETTANNFLKYAGMWQEGERRSKKSKRMPKNSPQNMGAEDIVKLVNAMKGYDQFLAPDPSCLSPLGEDLLATGIKKELEISEEDISSGNAFVSTIQRKPTTYEGFPFIVEVGLACSKNIPTEGKILLFRFANKIPLLFDEGSDVSWKVVSTDIDWRNYRVVPGETPVAVFVHLCSTKVPYKTVGKEFIADRPDVEHEILNAIREVARNLKLYLSRKEHLAKERRRLDVFEKYLPKVAQFSTKLSKQKKEPDVKPLLKSVMKYGAEEEEE